tara:strand:+ start:824 stop:1261 length:438 start_codon:yes stop_codon:yes gene_type:complete
MKQVGTLTQKQAAFCAFVADGHNQTDAYIKAYNTTKISRRAASTEGSKLMQMEKMRSRVNEIKEQATHARKTHKKISKDWILDKLRAEASDEENNPSVRVRALEILAKTEKLFDDSTNLTVVHRSVEDIEKELRARLEDLNITVN